MTTQPGYNAVAPQVDLPAMEHEVLAFWRDHGTFERTLAQTDGSPRWTFYEGPPTANGMPGTHHDHIILFQKIQRLRLAFLFGPFAAQKSTSAPRFSTQTPRAGGKLRRTLFICPRRTVKTHRR